MIDQLIAALNQEVDLSAEEIADTLWLAMHMEQSGVDSTSRKSSKSKPNQETTEDNSNQQIEPDLVEESLTETPTTEQESKKKEEKSDRTGVYNQKPDQTQKSLDIPFNVPDAPSLREQLDLARALRPLMRRIPSGSTLVLDEAATTQRIADEGIWLPVIKPTLEPWLDLELVFDESISMQIWRQTIKELERLLKNYGIFRDVRVWGLISSKQNKIQIRSGIGSTAKNQSSRSAAELIDSSGRRLVLVVSDCVSDLWRSGAVNLALQTWANNVPTAIIQMLPQWLWSRTALGRATKVKFQGLAPSVSNRQLVAKTVSLWSEIDDATGIKVPVFTLEPQRVSKWAQMLVGKGSIQSSGFVFKPEIRNLERDKPLFNLDRSELTPEKRVQAFRVTASPMARKLAGLLASAPVISLPVVRLIRETMLKDSQQVHVAEVFLGGLLKPLSEIEVDTEPDYVQYGFINGVRELLVDSVPTSSVLNVVEEISKFVSKKVGLSLSDFAAVLRNPEAIDDIEVIKQVQPFAIVTAEILRRLGGEYIKVADELEKQRLQKNTKISRDSTSNIKFQLGGCLPIDSSSYIQRKADHELYHAIKAGHFCTIFAPRQMGKTSLIVSTLNRLKNENFTFSIIDLQIIGSQNITQKQFYNTFIYLLIRDLNIDENLVFDTQKRNIQIEGISPNAWVSEIFQRKILTLVDRPLIIAIDEIDMVYQFDFCQDFFALLRGLSTVSRNQHNFFTFVISGCSQYNEKVINPPNSPLVNIANQIKLHGFTFKEALPLAEGLSSKTNNPQELLRHILLWTNGQPLLTQKIGFLVQESEEFIPEEEKKVWLDSLIVNKIIKNWQEQDNLQHLRTIENSILGSEASISLFKIYRDILGKEKLVISSERNKSRLIEIGLVIRRDEKLEVANPIYQKVFDRKWIDKNLKDLDFQLISNIYNAFDPFKTLQPGDPAYRECGEVRGDSNIQQDLGKKIILSNTPTCQLYAGHRGVGKSTELARLTEYLTENSCFVVYFSADQEDIDSEDAQYTDIILACARHLLKDLRKTNPDPILHWLRNRWQELQDLSLTTVKLDGLNIETAITTFAKITANLRAVPTQRAKIMELVNPHTQTLIDAVNEFIKDAQDKELSLGKTKLVIIADSLDRIVPVIQEDGRTNHDRIFIERSQQLKSLDCHVVYTVPISLLYSSRANDLYDNYGDTTILPMIMVQNPDAESTNYTPGLDKLKEIVRARINILQPDIDLETEIFENREVLEQICLMSGGHVRQLMQLIQETIKNINKFPITKQAAQRSIDSLSSVYRRTIEEPQWQILAELAVKKQIENSDKYRELLFNRCLLEYVYFDEGGELKRWCDVHPVIKELHEFKQAYNSQL